MFGDLGRLVTGPLVMGHCVMGHFVMVHFVMGRFVCESIFLFSFLKKNSVTRFPTLSFFSLKHSRIKKGFSPWAVN
jgi:hypothetical protein